MISLTVSVLVFAMALVSAVSESLRRFNALSLLEVESNYLSLSSARKLVGRKCKHCDSQHLTSGFGRWEVTGGCLQRCSDTLSAVDKGARTCRLPWAVCMSTALLLLLCKED